MKNYRFFTIVVIASLMLACNLSVNMDSPATPASNPPKDGASAQATETQAPVPATETVAPAPSDTPTITLTPTPAIPLVTPLDDPVNCRFGPGTVYESIGRGLAVGATAQIFGKSADGGWWQILDPSGGKIKCWVAASITTTTGDLTTIGVVAAPLAFVSSVTLKTKPEVIHLPGCAGPIMPISFKGSIQVNGPTTVKWHFVTQKDGPMSSHSTDFSMYGTQDVSVDYTPAGPFVEDSFWVRLIITSPNTMTAETTYQIKCS